MMRRIAAPSAVAAARQVSEYAFGQNAMDTDFLHETHKRERIAPVANDVRISRLQNGARVITHDRCGPQVTIGAYVEIGAQYDPATAPGLNYVLRWALSGSNMENSLFQLDRNARSVGAAREHGEIRKKWLSLKAESPAGAWPRLANDIFASISAPRFPEYDVERFRDTMDNLLEESRWNQPRGYAIDQLETVAFYREPLGNPRHVPKEFNSVASHGQLVAQWARLCVPTRVVIAGVNVDHDALVAAYENCEFTHRASAPHHAASTPLVESKASELAQYYPGNERYEQEGRASAMKTKPDMDEETIVAVGFPAAGAEMPNHYATSLVARQLLAMQLGESFAINKDAPHHGVESFYRPYTTVGLIGATIRADPKEAKAQTLDAVKAIRGLGSDASAISAAASRAIADFASENLDVNRDYCDFLGTSLLPDGALKRLKPDELFQAIKKVDAAAVKKLTESFQKTRPSLFATGETTVLPSLKQMGL